MCCYGHLLNKHLGSSGRKVRENISFEIYTVPCLKPFFEVFRVRLNSFLKEKGFFKFI